MKTLVEKTLSNIMRATIEVYPEDRRLLTIYDEMTTAHGDIDMIPAEEITSCVKKHYVEGYVSSRAVVEDLSTMVCVFT